MKRSGRPNSGKPKDKRPTNTKVIKSSDGRTIEIDKDLISQPPEAVNPFTLRRGQGKIRLTRGPHGAEARKPHYASWSYFHRALLWAVSPPDNFPGHYLSPGKGFPRRMTKKEAQAKWDEATKKAKVHMANIKKVHPNLLDERAEKAMVATLEIMESPQNQEMRLKAARQVLEWTSAKPVSKSEVSINAAEAWLNEIAEKAKDGED